MQISEPGSLCECQIGGAFGHGLVRSPSGPTAETAAARLTVLRGFSGFDGGYIVAEVLNFGRMKCGEGSLSVGDEISKSVSVSFCVSRVNQPSEA